MWRSFTRYGTLGMASGPWVKLDQFRMLQRVRQQAYTQAEAYVSRVRAIAGP